MIRNSCLLITFILLLFIGQLEHQVAAQSAELLEHQEADAQEHAEIGVEGDVQENTKKNPLKRAQKDWSKVNFDTLEKEWEGGDDKRELEHEFEYNRRVNEKKPKVPRTKKDVMKNERKQEEDDESHSIDLKA